MDPITIFVVATAMMLLNGGVLGLVHGGLPAYLQPSAKSWRIGTLLMAGGSILFAVQESLPPGLVLPLANGLLLVGLGCYWRALRLFYGEAETLWLFLPVLLGVIALYWFAAIQPSLSVRVSVATLIWVVYSLGCIWTLRSHARSDASISRQVMMGIFAVIILMFVLRMAYFASISSRPASVTETGSWVNALSPLLATVLPVIGTTAFLQMCSERIRAQWETAASTDYLTGLANRRQLTHVASQWLVLARSNAQPLAVMLIDIDRFKTINDRYGHDVGDRAIQHVANCLRGTCRRDDLLVRQGGEEFVMVLRGMDIDGAAAFSARVLEIVRAASFVADVDPARLTVSIGVAALRDDDAHLDDLLRRADHALYQAKESGRDRVSVA
jgi:diguanylate cyclase (GGDEF)-like protein